MGIRRARVTWFAVISGLPGAGTGRPYHQSSSEIIPEPVGRSLQHAGLVCRDAARLDEGVARRNHAAAVDDELLLRRRVVALLGIDLDPPARDLAEAAVWNEVDLLGRAVRQPLVVADRAVGLEARIGRQIRDRRFEARVSERPL